MRQKYTDKKMQHNIAIMQQYQQQKDEFSVILFMSRGHDTFSKKVHQSRLKMLAQFTQKEKGRDR